MGNPITYGQDTLNTIYDLKNRGIDRMAVILRHAARHYDYENWENDPYMGLTDEGKESAYTFGKKLPTDSMVRFFSSPVGRCIETSAQIEKGVILKGGTTAANRTTPALASFFAKDWIKAFELMTAKGSAEFFRDWFDGKVAVDVMADAKTSAATLLRLLVDKLEEEAGNYIDILSSHDWCLYLAKEYYLGLKREEVGTVDYLEGVVVYREDGSLYAGNHQAEPKMLEVPAR